MRPSLFLAAPLLVLAATGVAADDDAAACAPEPAAGACREVRARLSAWNGAPTWRLRPAGTNRLLGVRGDRLPEELRATGVGFDTELWGRFRVCPLTPQRAGRMQMVCIAAWRDLQPRAHDSAPR